jgi:hypothetical protein
MACKTGRCPDGSMRISPLMAIPTFLCYEVVWIMEYYEIMFCFTINMTPYAGCSIIQYFF